MPDYTTAQRMEDVLGRDVLVAIADHDRDGEWDPLVVGRAITAASSIASMYISAFEPLPFTPDTLERAVISLSNEMIRRDRDMSTDDSKLAFKDAMDLLKDVQKGNAVLIPTPPETIDPGDPEMYAQPRMWTRRTARGGF